MKLPRDTWLLFSHNIKITPRNPVWVVFGLFQPICYLLLFALLLEGVASAPSFGDSALPVFTPRLLIMQGIFGTTFVGFGLIARLPMAANRVSGALSEPADARTRVDQEGVKNRAGHPIRSVEYRHVAR